MREARVGYAQHAIQFGQKEANRAAFDAMIDQAADADLLVLPELALSGYDFPNAASLADLAEPTDGPTAAWLRERAAATDTILIAGYPEAAGDIYYNSAMLVTPEGDVHNYRKIHLFDRETKVFTPGDAPAPVIESRIGRIGIMICFDWVFPETARSLAMAGAQIIAHPSNLVLPWCQRAMFARCVENRVYAITANRIGTETQAGRDLTFTGQSQVMSPRGECLASAPESESHVATAVITPELADDKNITDVNHIFTDRRPEMYGTERD